MTFKLGLTGSIGMGKSTTAQMFVDQGCALWDADEIVRELYAPGGLAIKPVGELVPAALKGNSIDRIALRDAIRADDTLLGKLGAIVHPMVKASRSDFINATSADIAVFDIPLLFENGSEDDFDAVVCVFTDSATQKERVMARGIMTEDDLEQILRNQMPVAEKRARADLEIETDTLEHVRQQVETIVSNIREGLMHA